MEKEKIYDKLLDADFSKVEKTNEGYVVYKNYNSMRAAVHVDRAGSISKTETVPTALTWVLGLITFPLGSVALLVYIMARSGERTESLKQRVERILR
jgi:hypothetical protein